MEETTKYLIHADVVADGVVERSDVVGAVFGQTEGLLGDDLDLRDLQRTRKVGRIDAQIESTDGRSVGTFTIASRLDKVETAILAASLETIERVGPCDALVEVSSIEDVRAAKRRAVIERAKELLQTAFDEGLDSAELVEEVRESVRAGRITEYEGLPAGPRVADSDAVIVVEGRSDVVTLLRYGVKNVIAVEGTNVPEAIADLTRERTVTAFLDGDRGGELVLRELAQVGEVDYVAFAPEGRSVEDLARHEVHAALRDKAPFDPAILEDASPADDAVETDVDAEAAGDDADAGTDANADTGAAPDADTDAAPVAGDDADADADGDADADADGDADGATAATDGSATPAPETGRAQTASVTLGGHVEAVTGSGTARLLDGSLGLLGEIPAGEVFDALVGADPVPETVVIDGAVAQRLLDVAAQRGVGRIVAREVGELTKQPAGVRVLTTDEL